jgi:transcriptional regulator with XRE-family HTH domain
LTYGKYAFYVYVVQPEAKIDIILSATRRTRKDLASEIGYTIGAVNNAMKGRFLSAEILSAIEHALGAPIWSESPVERLKRDF